MNTTLPSTSSLACAVLRKYKHIVSARAYIEASAIMGRALAPDVAAYLHALDGCQIVRLTPDIIDWLAELGSAIVCQEVPSIS